MYSAARMEYCCPYGQYWCSCTVYTGLEFRGSIGCIGACSLWTLLPPPIRLRDAGNCRTKRGAPLEKKKNGFGTLKCLIQVTSKIESNRYSGHGTRGLVRVFVASFILLFSYTVLQGRRAMVMQYLLAFSTRNQQHRAPAATFIFLLLLSLPLSTWCFQVVAMVAVSCVRKATTYSCTSVAFRLGNNNV